MKRLRLLVGALVPLALAMSMAGAVRAQEDLPKNHACADITDGELAWDGSVLEAKLFLDAPSCRGVTYTIVVYDEYPGTTELASASVRGTGSEDADGIDTLTITLAVGDGDGVVCVVGTTTQGGQQLDRAPDNFCSEVSAGSAGGTGFH